MYILFLDVLLPWEDVLLPGKGPGELSPPLFLDQTEAWRVKKMFLEAGSPLSQSLDGRPPPHPLFLKVSSRHFQVKLKTKVDKLDAR